MKDKIFDYIKHCGNVSFAELSQDITGFKGNMALELLKNFIMWGNMSEKAANAIADLLHTKRIPTLQI